jgi:hypothetical protein
MTNQVLSSDLLVELSAEEQQQLAGGCCGGASNVPSCGCGDSSGHPGYGYGDSGRPGYGYGRRRRFGGWGHRTYKYGCR